MFLKHEPCPKCGSKDNLARYDDGHGYCFGCGFFEGGKQMLENESNIDFRDLPARGLKADACKLMGYGVTSYKGEVVHCAIYPGYGKKLRFPDKKFLWVDKLGGKAPLFGPKWEGSGKKQLVITEGECDAVAFCQATAGKWPVNSLPHGTTNKGVSAVNAIKDNYEYVVAFDRIVLCLDMDEPGQQAAKEISEILPPGKVFLAQLPLKDANDMLLAGRQSELRDAIFKAKEYRPEGIFNARDLWDVFCQPTVTVGEFPWEAVQNHLGGIRAEELVVLTAGTGVGKSTMAREIAYHNMIKGVPVGLIMLEESARHTMKSLVAISQSQRQSQVRPGQELRKDFDTIFGPGNCYIFNHFGMVETDKLINKMRYLVRGCGVKIIVLDHITMVSSGWDIKEVDVLVTKLKGFCVETKCCVLAIVHLRKTNSGDQSFERGGEIQLDDLRGAGSLKQIPDTVLALERDMQDKNAPDMGLTVLKCREDGTLVGRDELILTYVKSTGRVREATASEIRARKQRIEDRKEEAKREKYANSDF